jgi:hypothetical protein
MVWLGCLWQSMMLSMQGHAWFRAENKEPCMGKAGSLRKFRGVFWKEGSEVLGLFATGG